jgi:type I restriction enzyme R subunit
MQSILKIHGKTGCKTAEFLSFSGGSIYRGTGGSICREIGGSICHGIGGPLYRGISGSVCAYSPVFTDFKFDDLSMDEQTFEDYKSKYLDIYDKVKSNQQVEKVSILDDVDFELELIRRDDVNVSYILRLLAGLKDSNPKDREKKKSIILDLIAGEVSLRSKRELIEKFIKENLPNIEDSDQIEQEFEKFWSDEQETAFNSLCKDERLDETKLHGIISEYLFTERKPLGNDIVSILEVKPKILERAPVINRVTNKILDFVETFMEGVGV